MFEHGQWVTNQHDPGSFGNPRQDRGFDVHHTTHAVGIVMLVQRKNIKAFLFGIAVFVQIVVVIVSGLITVKILIGKREEGVVLEHVIFALPNDKGVP
jgi:hypothetical protein